MPNKYWSAFKGAYRKTYPPGPVGYAKFAYDVATHPTVQAGAKRVGSALSSMAKRRASQTAVYGGHRAPGSRSLAVVKRKPHTEESAGKGGDVAGKTSFFTHHMGSKYRKGVKFVGGTFKIHYTNAGGQSTGGSGKQAFTDFYWPSDTGLTLMDQIVRAQREYAAGVAINLASNPNASELIYMKSATQEFIFTNASTTAMKVCIQDLRCIRDTNNTAIAMMNNTSAGAGLADSVGNSGAAYGGIPNSTLTPVLPGFDIRESSGPRPYWKVVNTRYAWIAPGEVCTHRVKIKLNKFMNMQMLAQKTSNQTWFKGFSTGVLLTFYNAPVTGSTSGTDLAAGELRYYTICKIKFRYGIQMTNHIEQFSGAAGLVGNQVYVDEALGEVFTAGTGIGTAITA